MEEPIYLLFACMVLVVMWSGIMLLLIGADKADDANEKWARYIEAHAPRFDDDLGMMEVDE